jgi:hypothetical protein
MAKNGTVFVNIYVDTEAFKKIKINTGISGTRIVTNLVEWFLKQSPEEQMQILFPKMKEMVKSC